MKGLQETRGSGHQSVSHRTLSVSVSAAGDRVYERVYERVKTAFTLFQVPTLMPVCVRERERDGDCKTETLAWVDHHAMITRRPVAQDRSHLHNSRSSDRCMQRKESEACAKHE